MWPNPSPSHHYAVVRLHGFWSIIPSLEYCSAIWDPYHHTSIGKLEMIQHRAVRFVLNKPWHRSN